MAAAGVEKRVVRAALPVSTWVVHGLHLAGLEETRRVLTVFSCTFIFKMMVDRCVKAVASAARCAPRPAADGRLKTQQNLCGWWWRRSLEVGDAKIARKGGNKKTVMAREHVSDL